MASVSSTAAFFAAPAGLLAAAFFGAAASFTALSGEACSATAPGVFAAPSSPGVPLAAAVRAVAFPVGAFPDVLPAGATPAAALAAGVSRAVALRADVLPAPACPAGARFPPDAPWAAPPPAGAGPPPCSVDAGFPAVVAWWGLFAPAAGARAVFTGPARPAWPASAREVFLPPAPSAPPPEAAAPLERPDAGCCTAVFFATMAAAPSHIVILLANRAGTINRLESRGNGAHRPIRPPASPEQRTCNRCAQLSAG
ncbi:hypothetical protein [Streptomyces sp. NPDC015414]|uniref:hypothetical protein n=1 Tax=unclassified Streptomyces TaxID=2593676 RepID=UPI0036FDED85